MTSKVELKEDNKLKFLKLWDAYEKEYDEKASTAQQFKKYKKSFQDLLKANGASGQLPMSDKDYQKVAGASNLNKLVKDMNDMQGKASDCLLQIKNVTSDFNSLIADDANEITVSLSKVINDEIKEIAGEMAELQKKMAALNAQKNKILDAVKSELKQETKDIVSKLEGLKKEIPMEKDTIKCFDFNSNNKYLREKKN